MFTRNYSQQLLLLLLALPLTIIAGPVSNPEVASKSPKQNTIQQQQQQSNQQKSQDAHLNSLNVYANQYDIIGNNQNSLNNGEQFKPSYKLPDIETNFTPIQNSNSIAPDFASISPGPVLMQYLPQTITEGGVQYLQLIPTRPLMVPIGPYLTAGAGTPTLGYTQTITATHPLDYGTRSNTLLSTMPVNMVPPAAPTSLLEVPSQPLNAYGIQSYAPQLQTPKQNYRINRETKDRFIPGPLNLNTNEYIPGPGQPQSPQQQTGLVRGRP
ncbi:uncharacterized protein LOC142229551 [Haematobia irritans]|uniref:uncharacterized protein LOC142229551 n=1 Tax=Haematobia irritans TaxID=7368 RepID=UPI003F50A404